jgi:L-iditol 2-dehydrogenase
LTPSSLATEPASGSPIDGLLAVAAAHARAVDAVWIREPRDERRRLAEAWGAGHHADEPVDVALVTTANREAIEGAAAALAPGGTLCLFATTGPGTPVGVDSEGLFLRELTVCSSWSAGPADMRAAYDLLASGRVDPRPLVTHRVGLEQTGEALNLQRRGETIKAVVLP